VELCDVLPDRWSEVAYRRRRKHQYEQIKNMFVEDDDGEDCVGCPNFRVWKHGYTLLTGCIVNKCIKQYPHIYDNKEFK